MKLQIKKLEKDVITPSQGSSMAAGIDLHAYTEGNTLSIPAQSNVLVPTKIAVKIPKGYFGGIFARSGLSTKQGLRPANCVGIVDADYRGEVKVPLYNDTHFAKTIEKGDRIAQLILIPCFDFTDNIEIVEELDDTDRSSGGFGSTGV